MGKINNSSNILFIIGRGRSGTSLLSKILNVHPEVCIPAELICIFNLISKYSNVDVFTESVVKNIIEDIFLEKRISKQRFNKDELQKDLLKYVGQKITYNELSILVLCLLAKQLNRRHPKIVGDKNPHYALFIKQLIRFFPQAKFVYIVRDHRDNVCSYQNMHFDVNNKIALAYRWKLFNRKILKWKKHSEQKFFYVKYEDLVQNPESNIKKICSFLDIGFEKQMLTFFKRNTFEAEAAWHHNLKHPLHAKNIGKWKHILSKTEEEKINYVCGKVAQKLGYIDMQKYSFLRKTYLFLATLFPVLYAWLYTMLERSLFIFFPLRLRTKLINYLRNEP